MNQRKLSRGCAEVLVLRSTSDGKHFRRRGRIRPLVGALVPPLLVASLALVVHPSSALAWGDTGHEIVALIAEHFLTPNARAKVDAILATDTGALTAHDFAAEATWADKFRDSDRNTTKEHYNQTHNWHFIDIELASKAKPDLTASCFGRPALPSGTAASKGPADDCVIDKIEEFKAELVCTAASQAERLEALQFLLHFVGDVHQPLHASDDQDQGGNKKDVTWEDDKHVQQKGSLHHYWDALPETLGSSRETVAASLIKQITGAQAKSWAKGSPEDWAKESFKEAVSAVYGQLPKQGADGKYALNAAYTAQAKKVASSQLRRAGVRLAAVLNEALK